MSTLRTSTRNRVRKQRRNERALDTTPATTPTTADLEVTIVDRPTAAAPVAVVCHQSEGVFIRDISNQAYLRPLDMVRKCLAEVYAPSTTPSTVLSTLVNGRPITAGEWCIRYWVAKRRKRPPVVRTAAAAAAATAAAATAAAAAATASVGNNSKRAINKRAGPMENSKEHGKCGE